MLRHEGPWYVIRAVIAIVMFVAMIRAMGCCRIRPVADADDSSEEATIPTLSA